MVDKGKISTLKDGGTTAEVIPSQSSSAVTTTLTVPQLLQGNLSANTEVVYAVFDDNTGIILDRLDGKNTHKHNYTHGGTSSGSDTTSGPVK